MPDFINSTVNTKVYNQMDDECKIIRIYDKEVSIENVKKIVEGDTNSSFLTFEIDRYQNGVDLSDKKIRFNYRNSNGKFYDLAVNVKYNDNVIRFSWLLPYSLTQPGGNVIASIDFYGYIEYDEEYSYKTKNFKLTVEKSLGIDDKSDESYNNWTIKIENDVETIQNKISEIEKDVESIHVPTKLSEMDDDTGHRTVSDLQIQAWNEAQKNVQVDWAEKNTNSDTYIKNKPQIPNVTNDLTDELKRAYDDAVEKKHTHLNKSVLDEITQDNVESWNNKSEFDGQYSSLQGIPEDIATETYVDEKVKSKVNDSDLAIVAKTGSYNDLKDKPDSLPSSDVYQWAKEPKKPTYTAYEVGALPDTTQIPSVDDVNELKGDLVGKLDKPETAPAVGKILKVTAVNEDGSFVCEWAEGGGDVKDVQIDGASIVQGGVANIPQIKGYNIVGVTKVIDGCGLYYQGTGALAGSIAIRQPSQSDIDEHAGIRWQRQFQPITVGTLDYALKVGMCDGKASAWTDTEKTGAWSRLSSIKTAMDDVAVAGAHYILGEMTEVSVVLPDDALIGQEVTVTWYNGDAASTLSITGNMLDFDYTPEANTRSEINCQWDGRYWSVIGLSQDVPSEEVASE